MCSNTNNVQKRISYIYIFYNLKSNDQSKCLKSGMCACMNAFLILTPNFLLQSDSYFKVPVRNMLPILIKQKQMFTGILL